MSARYLEKTVSARVAANGTATAVISPSVGEFWAPSVVVVSTVKTPQNTSFVSSSYCAVFKGASTMLGSVTLVDSTYLGSGDTSTIIAGSVVPYGQSITAQWNNAIANDTALLTVYGRVFDNIVELQNELSPVPGAKFAGGSGNGMVWDYSSSTISSGTFASPPTFITPGDSLIEVVAVHLKVTADAVVGNRIIGMRCRGTIGLQANTDLFVVFNGAVQTATQTFTYVFGQGMYNYNAASNVGCAIPIRVIIPPISTIDFITNGVDAGDAWSEFSVSYRRYTSLTKVSYT